MVSASAEAVATPAPRATTAKWIQPSTETVSASDEVQQRDGDYGRKRGQAEHGNLAVRHA